MANLQIRVDDTVRVWEWIWVKLSAFFSAK